ncbi:Uncharacterised protein [Moraxella lacunata]|jgi:hypothetical protein|uniref:Uncharacterized protein n=1 Tax=Moraxella lacunata TaxID=477 RepID=A0A1V4GVN6_MORLA|nr:MULTISPECIES: hypothetical protein [Moraxella]DAQ41691.1 MAG TPA: hypothetical protein [Caudoviricetes sp.]MCG7412071.1 hypothetical protein [Moraxella nonliquefaciens]MDI4497366.1 hypothetical protein [Moraxella nonliquefaciens]MDI4499301.1 hypothetical protein [Moraxella nonliquefaciens]OPH36490.1 hypothetical protein B5J94_07090 [Moraxella lacunata]
MSDLSKEQVKEAYAKAIEVLFGGVVQASPNEITEQVIQDVDKMISEIANCSQNIAKIGIDIIYKATIGRVVDAATGYFDNILIDTLLDEATSDIQDKIEELFSAWIMALMGNRRFVACLYQARRNWRSKIQIELMGL